jgi:glycosyltransferase involved in cell wall biosynthesis
MEQFKVSVIIPTRDRQPELIACLEAMQLQTFPARDYELLICDDGSIADLTAALKPFQTKLNLVYLRQLPQGPAAARNLGISNARAPIVAMTDSDTLPDREWLAQLVMALQANPQAVAVEGKVTSEKPDEFGALGEGPTNLEGGVYLTCNCAYRRDVLLKAGGFDESFPYPAYEDVELAARVRPWGEIVWQPDAIVYHSRRRITSATVLKKLKHWEYVLIMGLRYGYLGWPRYSVSHPVSRVMLLSVIALPFSKFKEALSWLFRKPAAAIELCRLGLLESFGALFLVVPSIISGKYKQKIQRKNYLSDLASSDETP